jgi:hypothetical protein
MRPRGFIEPCLPTNARSAPGGPQWAYEITDRVPLIAEALQALRVKSGASTCSGQAAGRRSCMHSTCWSSTAPTCTANHGKPAVRGWRACCGRHGTACGCPSTSTATARSRSPTPAAWAWEASSPNVGTGRIGPGAARTGSR